MVRRQEAKTEKTAGWAASSYNHSSETLYDIVLQQFNENTLERRIDAKRASWNGEHWFFVNGFDRRFGGDEETVITFDTLVVRNITETPADFAKDDIDEENMNYEELKQYIDKVRRSGGNIERYLVDLDMLLDYGKELGGDLLEPIKSVNVQNQRCMTTWVLRKH